VGVIAAAPVNTPSAWSERADTVRDPWLACGWSRDGQVSRHQAAAAALSPQAGETLLDWGCGTGDFAGHVDAAVGYVGFDYARGMIERARRAHPDRAFTNAEPLGHFDLVACIGCFNLPDHWSKQRTWHTLRHLWDTKTPRALVASLYAGADDRCLRYTIGEALDAGHSLAYDVRVAKTRANDLILVVRR